MKARLQSISNIPFIVCLILLLINDFYLKTEYHNWLTGKLSDFCGLFVFVSFWAALIPNKKRVVYSTVAVLFVLWKSPYSQPFIVLFTEYIYPIYRVVDITDLTTLLVLPVAFYFDKPNNTYLKLNPIPLAILSIFAFSASSAIQPSQNFEQPQYLLFKSGLKEFQSTMYLYSSTVYDLDSICVVNIESIPIDKKPVLDDEFHKVHILKDLDIWYLKASTDQYLSQGQPTDYEYLKERLTIKGNSKVTLQLISVTDHLEFTNMRLNGFFQRFSNTSGQLLIQGKYKDGFEDSTWTYYDSQGEISSKKHFEEGELTKTETFEDSKLVSKTKIDTRQETIRNKYFQLATIFVITIGLLAAVYSNYKGSTQDDIINVYHVLRIVAILILPLCNLGLARVILFRMSDNDIQTIFGFFEGVEIAYISIAPIYTLIFYLLKLRNKFDIIYYFLVITLVIVIIEKSIFLKAILAETASFSG